MTPVAIMTLLSIVTPLHRWTCVLILTPSAIVTPSAMWVFSPMMHSRPMTDGPRTWTPSPIAVRGPIVTPGSMIAVGWMCGASAAAATGRDQGGGQHEQGRVRHDGVADLELGFAEAPRAEAHGQLAHAVTGEEGAQHDLRHRYEAVRAEGDAHERVAAVGAEEAGEGVYVPPDEALVEP